MRRTKVTAVPNPNDVLTFFDTARNEHIPRKYAKIMLSINIERIKILNDSILLLLLYWFLNPDNNTYNDKCHRRQNHKAVVHIASVVEGFRYYAEAEQCA